MTEGKGLLIEKFNLIKILNAFENWSIKGRIKNPLNFKRNFIHKNLIDFKVFFRYHDYQLVVIETIGLMACIFITLITKIAISFRNENERKKARLYM